MALHEQNHVQIAEKSRLKAVQILIQGLTVRPLHFGHFAT